MGWASPQENVAYYLLPLPEMNRTDADVALAAITFRVARYQKPVDDPMFAAHKPLLDPDFANNTVYGSDYPVGLLGCAVQVLDINITILMTSFNQPPV
jgi:hypothetical protein